MKARKRKIPTSSERPASPGIPGDYFECTEIMLVKKLHALRLQEHPITMVPPLLEPPASSSIQSHEDNPDLFFDDFDPDDYHNANNLAGSSDLVDILEGEQLSVHSHSSTGTAEEPNPKPLQGTQIILNVKSFLPTGNENVMQRRPLGKHSPSVTSPRTVTKFGAQSSDMVSTATPATPATVSLSLSTPASFDVSDLEHKNRYYRHTLPTISDAENDLATKESAAIALHDHPPIPRTWSFSSSIDGDDVRTESFGNSNFEGPQSTTGKSSDSQNHDALIEQELFMRLSEEEDLRDFKQINNFTSDGDYLFSRMLRERTRIQLKREMLNSSDKDLYVQTLKLKSSSAQTERDSRNIFFAV